MNSSIRIRWGRLPDLGPLTDLHMRAFDGHRAMLLGRDYVERGHAWFMDQPDTICLVAESDGDVVGFVEGAPDDYAPRMSRALVPAGVRALLRKPLLFAEVSIRHALKQRIQSMISGSASGGFPHALRRGSYVLLSIAVDENYRGSGVAGRLIRSFEKEVASGGYERLRLSVYRDNARARRAYENAGWQLVETDATFGCYYAKQVIRAPTRSLESPFADTNAALE